MMEIVTDLHMHSTCLGGEYPPSPDNIVEKMIKAGLSTFALSDHDTLDYIPIINDYIKNKNINIQFIAVIKLFHPFHSEIQIQYYLNYANKNNSLANGLQVEVDASLRDGGLST